MEQQLLEAVLSGQLELSAALAWALGEAPEPPPIALRASSPLITRNGAPPVLRPADFRVHTLNYVREQAELVLAAAEHDAGAGGSSQPPTPQLSARGAAPEPEASSAAAAAPAAVPGWGAGQHQRRASGGTGGSTRQQTQPGRIDDDNFPTLAAAAASSSGSRRQSGGGAGLRGSPTKQQGSAGAQQQQGGKRRTIAPDRVASLHVQAAFTNPAAEQQPQPPQQAWQQQPATATVEPATAPVAVATAAAPPTTAAAAAPAAAAAAASLPMSPPPVAVRLLAPGVTAATAAAAGAGGEGGTPKRITPLKMDGPAEVQHSFLEAESATSPRAARQEMLRQADKQRTPTSRLGTPLAGASMAAAAAGGGAVGMPFSPAGLAAFGSLEPPPAAGAAGDGGSSRSSSGAGGTGSTRARSPLQWPDEQQSIRQQLAGQFDALSPPRPAALVASGSSTHQAAVLAAVQAPASPPAAWPAAAAAAAAAGSTQQAAIAGTAAPPAQGRKLDAAMKRLGDRLAPPSGGGSSSTGFDAPSSSSTGFDAPSRNSSAASGSGQRLAGAEAAAPTGSALHQQQQVPQQRQQSILASLPPLPARPAQQGQQQPPAGLEAQQQQEDEGRVAVGAGGGAGGDDTQLCREGRLLAELHGGLLRCCSSINLSAELDLLLNLLAVPAGVRVEASLAAAGVTRLWCGGLAQQYACHVLQNAGSLIRGLGKQLLAELALLPLVQLSFPRLYAAMNTALRHMEDTQLHTEKGYQQVRSGGGGFLASLQGVAALTSDGRYKRTQEEQRRISNREACRDEWFGLMKEAAAQTTSFNTRQLGRLALAASDRQSESGRTATTAAGEGGDEAGLLAFMRVKACDLLRKLKADNLPDFAELLVAAVLQAAATGETLLDEELSRLARKNPGRFHSLNQRMQSQGAPGPSRGGAARLQSNQPLTATGFGRSGSASSSNSGGRGGGRQQQQRGGGPGGGRGGGGGAGGGGGSGGVDEAMIESLRLVAEFPRPQRLYVLFLEAADSHRLNCQLMRVMSAKLRVLAAVGEHAGGGSSMSERVAALSTLATYLSYLAFTRGGSGAGAGGTAYDGSHPVDALAALEAAAASSEAVSLACTLPWVLRYLWLLKWDAEAAQAPYFRRLLGRLAALHRAAEMRPEQPQFGLAAFALRSLLDEFADRVGPDLLAPVPWGICHGDSTADGAASSSSGEGSSSGICSGRSIGAVCRALFGLPAVDGLLDSRYLHLCCPALDHSRQLFAAGGGGGSASTGGLGVGQQRQQQARRVKKIRPTAPSGVAAARAAQAPLLAGGVAAGGQDLLKLQLQRAFLEQYSTDEHKVKLKDVVDYVSDVLVLNCTSSAADALLAPAADAIGAQLREAAAVLVAVTDDEELQQQQQAQHAPDQQPQQAQQQPHPLLDSSVKLQLDGLAEQLIDQFTLQVLHQAQEAAERQIRANSVQAMAALMPPELGPAVIGTAAAVVAEVATAAAEYRLLQHVRAAIRQAGLEQLKRVIDAAARSGSAGGGGGNRAALLAPASAQPEAAVAVEVEAGGEATVVAVDPWEQAPGVAGVGVPS